MRSKSADIAEAKDARPTKDAEKPQSAETNAASADHIDDTTQQATAGANAPDRSEAEALASTRRAYPCDKHRADRKTDGGDAPADVADASAADTGSETAQTDAASSDATSSEVTEPETTQSEAAGPETTQSDDALADAAETALPEATGTQTSPASDDTAATDAASTDDAEAPAAAADGEATDVALPPEQPAPAPVPEEVFPPAPLPVAADAEGPAGDTPNASASTDETAAATDEAPDNLPPTPPALPEEQSAAADDAETSAGTDDAKASDEADGATDEQDAASPNDDEPALPDDTSLDLVAAAIPPAPAPVEAAPVAADQSSGTDAGTPPLAESASQPREPASPAPLPTSPVASPEQAATADADATGDTGGTGTIADKTVAVSADGDAAIPASNEYADVPDGTENAVPTDAVDVPVEEPVQEIAADSLIDMSSVDDAETAASKPATDQAAAPGPREPRPEARPMPPHAQGASHASATAAQHANAQSPVAAVNAAGDASQTNAAPDLSKVTVIQEQAPAKTPDADAGKQVQVDDGLTATVRVRHLDAAPRQPDPAVQTAPAGTSTQSAASVSQQAATQAGAILAASAAPGAANARPTSTASTEKASAGDGDAVDADGVTTQSTPARAGAEANSRAEGVRAPVSGVSDAAVAFARRMAEAASGRRDNLSKPTGDDFASLLGRQSPSTITTTPLGTATATTTATPPSLPVQQIASQMAGAALTGQSKFDINIEGDDLGRVEVRLDIHHDGRTHAHIVVDRKETLDMMMRDQRHLEQALRDSGLEAGEDTLSFSLRDDGTGDSRHDRQEDRDNRGPRPVDMAKAAETPASAQIVAAYTAKANGRIDLRV
ncbi:flagellar hook-length control protein FliK [Hartmannibacter diazotrophicus]|uniref:flagellar hook-length control protein FliK n=1 Tax=Hartmannibacter diazotrophicus TaxID=1482074 RepID=UPI000C1596C3|nr:flagellar hook-length control protein FliK [Hartmannibacter diazotrophicus]